MSYRAPVRDIAFALDAVAAVTEAGGATALDALREAGVTLRLTAEILRD